MKKYTISKITIDYLTESLIDKTNNEKELEFITNIKEYIDTIIDGKNCLAYEYKRKLHTEICDKIDLELEKSKKVLSIKFRRELEKLRLEAYIKFGCTEGHGKRAPLISDHFIHKNNKRLNQTSELKGDYLDFSKEYTTEYFLDKKNLKRDLQFFADQKPEKKGNSIISLGKGDGKYIPESINTLDGKKIKYQSYLHTASSRLLGTVRREEGNEPNLEESLLKMKTILGLYDDEKIPFSIEYFENLDFVKSDLQQFANIMKMSRKGIKKGNILDLTTDIQNESKIKVSNGIELKWSQYLQRACSAYKTSKGQHTSYQILSKLKNMLGLVQIDKDYFNNKEYIKYDLEQFAKFGNLKNIEDLNTTSPNPNTIVTISNGQEKKWSNYVDIASGYYLLTHRKGSGTSSSHKKKDAINTMLQFIKGDSAIHVDEKIDLRNIQKKLSPESKIDSLNEFYEYLINNIDQFIGIKLIGENKIDISNLKTGMYKLANCNGMNNKSFGYFIYELLNENEKPIKKDGTHVRKGNDLNTSIIKDLLEILFKKYGWEVINK